MIYKKIILSPASEIKSAIKIAAYKAFPGWALNRAWPAAGGVIMFAAPSLIGAVGGFCASYLCILCVNAFGSAINRQTRFFS